jgi:hypothetical protein
MNIFSFFEHPVREWKAWIDNCKPWHIYDLLDEIILSAADAEGRIHALRRIRQIVCFQKGKYTERSQFLPIYATMKYAETQSRCGEDTQVYPLAADVMNMLYPLMKKSLLRPDNWWEMITGSDREFPVRLAMAHLLGECLKTCMLDSGTLGEIRDWAIQMDQMYHPTDVHPLSPYLDILTVLSKTHHDPLATQATENYPPGS